MNGLDTKQLLIGSLKIRQQKYLKVFLLVVLFAFHFQLIPPLQSGETILVPQKKSH